MSQSIPKGNKNAPSDSYAVSSGNLDLFNPKSRTAPTQQRQVIKNDSSQPQKVTSKLTKCCTVLMYILLVLCVLIGAGGIALSAIYFNTSSSTQGWKIGGIVIGAIVFIVGIILIIVAIFKQKHKRPWRHKKEKNFFYENDSRKNGGKESEMNVENFGQNDNQMIAGNPGNRGSVNNNSNYGAVNNNYGGLNSNSGPLNTSYGGLNSNSRQLTSSYGGLNSNSGSLVPNYKEMNNNNNNVGQNNRYIDPNPSINTNNDKDVHPFMYSLGDTEPYQTVVEPRSNSVIESSQLTFGNDYPRQNQPIAQISRPDLIPFPKPIQPTIQRQRQDLITPPRQIQSTLQTSRSDLITFPMEDERQVTRNTETFTAFDRPATFTNLRSARSDVTVNSKPNITESVIVRRVPIPTTKVVAKQPSTKVVIVKVPNVAGQLVMQPKVESIDEQIT